MNDKMKIAIVLNFLAVPIGVIIYFFLAFGAALAATPSAETGALITLYISWGSAFIALVGALIAIVVSNKLAKWRFALASTIGAIICFPFLGIPSLVLIITSRKAIFI